MLKKYISLIIILFFSLNSCAPKKKIEPSTTKILSSIKTKNVQQNSKPIQTEVLNFQNKEELKPELIWSNKRAKIKKVYYNKEKKNKQEKVKIDVEYKGTDIGLIIKQIFGDILGYNYVIHPNVRGTLNLKISGEYTKEQIFKMLDAACNFIDVGIIKKENFFEFIRIRDNLKYGKIDKDLYIYVYYPKFVSARELYGVVNQFISHGGRVFVSTSKDFLIIADYYDRIQNIENLLNSIDINLLKNKEIRIFKLAFTDAKDLAKELEKFLIGLGYSRNDKKYSIIPIERLNYIILISSSSELMSQMESLIKLLDVGEKNAKKQIYIYKVQYVNVKDLANTLINFFAGKQKIEVKKKKGSQTQRITSSMLSEEVVIIPDETTNYLLIDATPSDYKRIMTIIKELDAMPRQVLIEMLIAEISLNNGLEHGLEWWLKKKISSYSVSGGIQYGLAGSQSSLMGFTYYGINPNDFWNFIYFLSTKSSIDILSSPHIVVRDNKSATINIGSEVPIATGETLGSVQSGGSSAIERRIEYKDVGVILKVTPHISEDGFVTLEINQEVSTAAQNTISGIDSPIISKRQTETTLMVQDGHSIVIGGIIKHQNNRIHKTVPLLGDIPVIGHLFSYDSITKESTELLIMLTPHVLRTPTDADLITKVFQQKLKKIQKSGIIKQK